MAEEVIDYSDLYSYAIDMHRALGSVFSGFDTQVLELDDKSVYTNTDKISGRQDPAKPYVAIIRSVQNDILINFSQIAYMNKSFVDLFKYTSKKFDTSTFDEFLTNKSEKVFSSFVDVSKALAETISVGNTK